jgi:uncharacterized membrane protein YphA (DoxX/SURF4 family)
MKKIIPWLLPLFVAFVFIQSLFFKFSGSVETEIIFSTIATWMSEISLLAALSDGFRHYGGIVIGSVELVASMLILLPKTRVWGALMGLMTMTGAIFFHLFTPLGVNRIVDTAGNTDGGVLFIMACGVWLSCATLIIINKEQLKL